MELYEAIERLATQAQATGNLELALSLRIVAGAYRAGLVDELAADLLCFATDQQGRVSHLANEWLRLLRKEVAA